MCGRTRSVNSPVARRTGRWEAFHPPEEEPPPYWLWVDTARPLDRGGARLVPPPGVPPSQGTHCLLEGVQGLEAPPCGSWWRWPCTPIPAWQAVHLQAGLPLHRRGWGGRPGGRPGAPGGSQRLASTPVTHKQRCLLNTCGQNQPRLSVSHHPGRSVITASEIRLHAGATASSSPRLPRIAPRATHRRQSRSSRQTTLSPNWRAGLASRPAIPLSVGQLPPPRTARSDLDVLAAGRLCGGETELPTCTKIKAGPGWLPAQQGLPTRARRGEPAGAWGRFSQGGYRGRGGGRDPSAASLGLPSQVVAAARSPAEIGGAPGQAARIMLGARHAAGQAHNHSAAGVPGCGTHSKTCSGTAAVVPSPTLMRLGGQFD